jgi:hypothetical protein
MFSNLALFCLVPYLATFQKIGWFFPNHLVTLSEIEVKYVGPFEWEAEQWNKILFQVDKFVKNDQSYKTF